MTEATSEQLRISWWEEGGVTVVRLIGDAGFRNADRLADAMAAIAARRPGKLVIDLGRLAFISSLSIGVLVTLKYRLRREGAAMELTGMTPAIEEALRLSRLFDDVIVAVRS